MNRAQLASAIDDIDAEIERLQTDKRELFTAYREANGKGEARAAKDAIRKRQKFAAGKGAEIEEHEALVDEIFVEIAPRATRSTDHANLEFAA